MDQLNLTQRYHDNSLMNRWEHCRLVGLINKVYFIIGLSALGILVLVYALVISYSCLICDPLHNHGASKAANGCELCEMVILACITSWPSMIISLIIPIFLLKMVYVNNGLRSTDIPTDGKNVKSWLIYHVVYLVLWFISLSGILKENHSEIGAHLFSMAIHGIVLMIEINIVHKFNIESKIVAYHRNRSFEISDDI
uniref:ACYPI28551 protein n=1 Tax=Acyrthosiphon pisum TaxID=7029 RepID=C4WT75_ACYPI|nr:ACYPI28551 [Acyrthosiphon pisum]